MLKKNLPVLWILVVLLTITYGLSFLKSNEKENRKAQKTALLNPKNVDKVKTIQLSNGQSETGNSGTGNDNIFINFNENKNIWEISLSQENTNLIIPADSAKVADFLKELSKIINLYEVSEINSDNNSFGLKESPFSLSYYLSDNSPTEIFFGNHDFSGNFRYLTTDGKKVYEINSDIDKYLSTTVQSWSNPLIFSEDILCKKNWKDVQKITIKFFDSNSQKINTRILEQKNQNEKSGVEFSEYVSKIFDLRHSGFANLEKTESLMTMEIDYGDLSVSNIEIFSTTTENQYILQLNHKDNSSKNEYDYEMKISEWTYNKINTSKL